MKIKNLLMCCLTLAVIFGGPFLAGLIEKLIF